MKIIKITLIKILPFQKLLENLLSHNNLTLYSIKIF